VDVWWRSRIAVRVFPRMNLKNRALIINDTDNDTLAGNVERGYF
jgi:hypothetical protein